MNRLFFLHIPKCAGTTFYEILYNNYKYQQIAKIDGTYIDKSVKQIITYPEGKKVKIKCVMGHMYYGMHEYFNEKYKYITFLRNPTIRVLSLYYHIITTVNHPLHELFIKKHISLKSFLESEITQELSNEQVRRISGINEKYIKIEHLEIAQSNIKTDFKFVGITELFDESLVLLRNVVSEIIKINFINKNVGRIVSYDEDIHKYGDVILNRNYFDQILYDKHYTSLLRLIDKKELKNEIERFKIANTIFANRYNNNKKILDFYRKLIRKVNLLIGGV
jgi:hypothetical protein